MTTEVTIEKILHGGAGIGRIGKVVVFVPYSAPGDRLKVEITEQKRNYWQGKTVDILEASPLRTSPLCPYYGSCGGCNLQHLSYASQLVAKKLLVNDCLQRLGKIFVPPGNPLANPIQWRYRNKTQFPVSGPPWSVGFFKPRSHQIVNAERCLIQPEEFDNLRAALMSRLEGTTETAYDERSGTGNLRHIVLKRGAATGEIALMFVTATGSLSPSLHDRLPEEFLESPTPDPRSPPAVLVSIAHNVNPARTNRVLGPRYETLAGRAHYFEKLLDQTLRISSGSFFQANTAATELLVKRILKYLEPDGQKTVLDLYCGVGTISLPVASFVGNVIGIEMDPAAIADARANVVAAGARNVQIIEAPVEQGIKQVQQADAVILDPPRKGCPPGLLRDVVALKPQEIIYVSCNPTTLARDLAILHQLEYETIEVQPIDMFPQTAHVETVAKLVPAKKGTTSERK